MAARKRELHAAIRAIHAAHEDFRAWRRGDVGACFHSDLKHDERMISEYPDHPFVWLVSPHGTHACRLGTIVDCYSDVTTRRWEATSVGMLLAAVCDGCYAPEAIPQGWLRLYLWDGTRLAQFASLATLRAAVSTLMRARARASLDSKIQIAREDLALATHWGNPARAQHELDILVAESTSIADSDWGTP